MSKVRVQSVTRDQMARVDQVAVASGLAIRQMMEQAGLHLARLSQRKASNNGRVVIMVGRGNNGADGIAAARFLENWGQATEIVLAEPATKLNSHGKHHLSIARKMKIPIRRKPSAVRPAAIVDALLGYNRVGEPRKQYQVLIEWANRQSAPRIACDSPSGLDVTTGLASTTTFKAMHTVTLALPKTGLLKKRAGQYVGQLWLADLGIPAFVFRLARTRPGRPFTQDSLRRV